MLAWVRTHRLPLIILGLVAVAAAIGVPVAWRLTRPADEPLPVTVALTVPLPGRPSRFDYADVDPAAHRLFAAHMDDGVLLAIDTSTNRVVATVPDLPSVTGVVVVPELHRVFASVAGTGQVATIDEDTATVLARTPAGRFPDGLAYVPSTGQVWISDEAGGAETVLDADTGQPVATVSLGGEAGNVRYDPSSDRVLVDVQTNNRVAVIDPHTRSVTARVAVPDCDHDHGLLIAAGRAWVACDGNHQLIVLTLPGLTELGHLDVGDRPDVLAADPARGLVYVAAESGDVTTVDTRPVSGRVTGRAHLADNAHVVAVDPSTGRAYFPVPDAGAGRPALLITTPKEATR